MHRSIGKIVYWVVCGECIFEVRKYVMKRNRRRGWIVQIARLCVPSPLINKHHVEAKRPVKIKEDEMNKPYKP